MKWYKRDPSAALTGMIGLTLKERGAYNGLIDLLYARAPHGHTTVTDDLVAKALNINPRTWRALKRSLIAKGKVHETATGLMANRVENELNDASNRMRMTRELRVQLLKKQELRSLAAVRTTRSRYST